MIETTREKIAEYSYRFNQSREDYNFHELDSSLGSPKLGVGCYDDFEPSYLVRPDLHDVYLLLA